MFKQVDTYEEYLRWWPTGLLWERAPNPEYVPMRVTEDCVPEEALMFRWELQAGFHYAIKLEA